MRNIEITLPSNGQFLRSFYPFYRVSVTPVVAGTLIKKGFKVQVESGAGVNAKFRDADYEAAGASIVDSRAAFQTGLRN